MSLVTFQCSIWGQFNHSLSMLFAFAVTRSNSCLDCVLKYNCISASYCVRKFLIITLIKGHWYESTGFFPLIRDYLTESWQIFCLNPSSISNTHWKKVQFRICGFYKIVVVVTSHSQLTIKPPVVLTIVLY